MKQIPLTQGQIAIVDDADFNWLNQWKWHVLNYRYAQRGRDHKMMHRLILGLQKGDKRQADHINHNGLDNRRCNLRIVTHQQNQQNRNNPKGCSWNKQTQKWKSYICVDKKYVHLGYFDTETDAYLAYLKAKKQHHV